MQNARAQMSPTAVEVTAPIVPGQMLETITIFELLAVLVTI